jgi:hypothetical protein
MTFKQWVRGCSCGFRGLVFGWDYDMPLACPTCGQPTHDATERTGAAPGVIPDGIPGGIEIRHGLCNDDGTPRRYYSKTEIRREALHRGMVISGETPKFLER